jgi:hypothetical protein
MNIEVEKKENNKLIKSSLFFNEFNISKEILNSKDLQKIHMLSY